MSAAKALGLVGRKAGMTRVFTDAGETVPVTVIEALPNRVTQVRTVDNDGYRALQVAFGVRKASHTNKPQTGHYAKVKVAPGESLVEFRLSAEEGKDLQAGAELKVDLFTAGQVVDVTGTTTGKGYAGVMKRHNFGGLPAPASAWPVAWAMSGARSRTSRSCASTWSAICCWSVARCPAHRAAR
jgi:large subunit ribosomal protein L3